MEPNPDINLTVNRTYSVTVKTVGQLEVLEHVTGQNKSDLVRQAVDELYQRILHGSDNPTLPEN